MDYSRGYWKAFDDTWSRKWEGRTHQERMERAVLKIAEHMSYSSRQRHNKPHLMPAFGWHVSRWNYLPHTDDKPGHVREAEKMFPLRLWETYLENVTALRYEVYGMSRHENSYVNVHRREPPSLYTVPWEMTRHSLIVPYTSHPKIPFLPDPASYEDWIAAKDLTFWYHTTQDDSSHGGQKLRRFPITHNQTHFAGGNIGFTIPASEWIEGWRRSRFCFVVRGDTPSSHSFANALMSNCLPIIVSDHFDEVALPFGRGRGSPAWLNLEDFAFVFSETEAMENPGAIAAAVRNEDSVRSKLQALVRVRPLLLYAHPQSAVIEAVAMAAVITLESNTTFVFDFPTATTGKKAEEDGGSNDVNDYDYPGKDPKARKLTPLPRRSWELITCTSSAGTKVNVNISATFSALEARVEPFEVRVDDRILQLDLRDARRKHENTLTSGTDVVLFVSSFCGSTAGLRGEELARCRTTVAEAFRRKLYDQAEEKSLPVGLDVLGQRGDGQQSSVNAFGRLPRITLQEARDFLICTTPVYLYEAPLAKQAENSTIQVCFEIQKNISTRGGHTTQTLVNGSSRFAWCILRPSSGSVCHHLGSYLKRKGIGPVSIDVWLARGDAQFTPIVGTLRHLEMGLVKADFMAVGAGLMLLPPPDYVASQNVFMNLTPSEIDSFLLQPHGHRNDFASRPGVSSQAIPFFVLDEMRSVVAQHPNGNLGIVCHCHHDDNSSFLNSSGSTDIRRVLISETWLVSWLRIAARTNKIKRLVIEKDCLDVQAASAKNADDIIVNGKFGNALRLAQVAANADIRIVAHGEIPSVLSDIETHETSSSAPSTFVHKHVQSVLGISLRVEDVHHNKQTASGTTSTAAHNNFTELFHSDDLPLVSRVGSRMDNERAFELSLSRRYSDEDPAPFCVVCSSSGIRRSALLENSAARAVAPVHLDESDSHTSGGELVFAIYGHAGGGTSHDANMCIARDGVVLAALELERLFDVRYFYFESIRENKEEMHADENEGAEHFEGQLHRGLRALQQMAGLGNVSSLVFDVALHGVSASEDEIQVLKRVVLARRWSSYNHHHAHAAIGFFDSPFRTALIVSLDGGGNDGRLNTFVADRAVGIEQVDSSSSPAGVQYQQLGRALSEIASGIDKGGCCYYVAGRLWEYGMDGRICTCNYINGKKMGYAALGEVREDWMFLVEAMHYDDHLGGLGASALLGGEGGTVQEQRDFAATSQEAFKRIHVRHIERWLRLYPRVEGIVLTGGCALNVMANTEAKRRFPGYGIYIPASPHDGGLSVGAAWLYRAPPRYQNGRLLFAGPDLWDVAYTNRAGHDVLKGIIESWVQQEQITEHQQQRGRRTAVFAPDTSTLADLLAQGNVIGVIRGRSEFGPRALGHRSLVADPTLANAKAKMNRLKVREWWRPVAPMVAVEDMERLFEERVWSPFMSFAPRLRPEVRDALPAIVHFDGTARVQTVAKYEDPWLHALLMAMKRRNGFAVLCNTSFNVKGRPIINNVAAALSLLAHHTDLDYVFVQGWLVGRSSG
jgi:carbamoyltransferase